MRLTIHKWIWIMCIASWANYLLAVGMHLSTYSSVSPEVLTPLLYLNLALVPFLWCSSALAWRSNRVVLTGIAKAVPVALILMTAIVLIYAAIDFFLTITILGGQPVIGSDGSYYLSTKSGLFAISYAEYLQDLRYIVRLLTGHTIIFMALGSGLITMLAREFKWR